MRAEELGVNRVEGLKIADVGEIDSAFDDALQARPGCSERIAEVAERLTCFRGETARHQFQFARKMADLSRHMDHVTDPNRRTERQDGRQRVKANGLQ
jgi:hypothetical protein